MKLSSILPRLLAVAALFFFMSSCSENLDSSGVCGVLCPPIGGDVKTITLDAAVEVDTSVNAFSGLGTDPTLLLAKRGDTLDTRVIIRFDSLPQTFIPAGDTAHPITSVDSAYIQFIVDTTSIKGTNPVTIEAYDVDTTANDTSTAAILALFRPDRFISSQTFARAQLTDTLKYFISNSAILTRIQNKQPLRIGLRATGVPGSSQMRMSASESPAGGPVLFFRATPDTATKPVVVLPLSKTPADDRILSAVLVDYTIIAEAPPEAPSGVLSVGGLPARRTYFRFSIPDSIIDSSTVVRATLLLNQIPNAAIDANDTVKVVPQVVLAGRVVTDPTKAAQIIAAVTADTLRLKPGGSGETAVELARAFALWHAAPQDTLPRAIVLQSAVEGSSPLELRFSSSEDIAALRPRLRISYTSRVPLGLP
ncbi:MAG TPA: hypothetical protein VJ825_10050 [Gemmatimonadaceae bacterium]|nr:hypothetical protein [Gemmatimonadaceae bacterium]